MADLDVNVGLIADFCMDPKVPLAKRAKNFTTVLRAMPAGWEGFFARDFETMNSGAKQVAASHEVIKMALLLALVAKDLIDAGAVFCVPDNTNDEAPKQGESTNA